VPHQLVPQLVHLQLVPQLLPVQLVPQLLAVHVQLEPQLLRQLPPAQKLSTGTRQMPQKSTALLAAWLR